MKKRMKLKAFILSITMIFQLLGNDIGIVKATENLSKTTDVVPTQVTEEKIPKTLTVKITDMTAVPKNITETYVNPYYEDIMDESMLRIPSTENNEIAAVEEVTYYTDIEDVAVEFRKEMKQKEENIVVYYAATGLDHNSDTWGSDVKAIMHEISDKAMVHTGIPTEGDYIAWQYGGWNCGSSTSLSNGTYCFTFTYTVTYYTTLEQENRMDAKVEELLTSWDIANEEDYVKIRTIYDYICENVVYDYENLEDDTYKLKHTAYAALIDGTSVCQGYAVLFYRLALELGVDNRFISGIGNGGLHGWNIVKLGDYYYNLDSTWDAGQEEYNYFLTCDANFGDHTRDEEYLTEEFYAAYPMDAEDYVYVESNEIANGTCGENITWVLDKEGVLTISGEGAMTNYTDVAEVPWSSYNNQITTVVIEEGVTTIGEYAFYGCNQLTDITMWGTVISIGEKAFAECIALKHVSFEGNAPTYIAEDAFTNVNAQVTYVYGRTGWKDIRGKNYGGTLFWLIVADASGTCGEVQWALSGSTLAIVGEGAMQDYTSVWRVPWYEEFSGQIRTVVIEEGVTTIGDYVFYGLDNVTSINLPEGITKIGQYSFYNWIKLKEITIPQNVITIGSQAFANCNVLQNVYFDGIVPTISEDAFIGVTANIYYYPNMEGWEEIVTNGYNYGGTLTWIPIIEEIANGTCGDTLTWTLNNNGLLNISGEGAMTNYTYKTEMPWYSYLENITAVVIDDGITTIGDYAFYGMPNLISITIPETVTKIEDYAFKNCKKLDNVMLPSGLTKLGESSFYACSSLTSIDIPSSLWTVRPYTFKNCISLASVTFHEGNLQKISNSAFYNTALIEVVLPDCLDILDAYVFKNCTALNNIRLCTETTGLTEIRESTFYGCTALTAINIPEGVTIVKGYAFKGCTKLASVVLPSTIINMEDSAFHTCTSIKNIIIPASVETIGEYCFSGSYNLWKITFEGNAPNIGKNAFKGLEANAYYPSENETWISDVMQDYGGRVTWKAN